MSRQEQRDRYDVTTRLSLLEQDADATDEVLKHLREDIQAQTRILMGVLIAVATSAVMLAVNVVVQAQGG